MKKAIQVMATLVAFLLSAQSFAARIYPTMPPIKDVFGTATTVTVAGDAIKVTGAGTLFPNEFLSAPVNKSLALVAESTVKSSAISTLAKNVVKGGVAGIVIGATFEAMLDGVDWVIKDGVIVKPGTSTGVVPTDASKGEYVWRIGSYVGSSPQQVCQQYADEGFSDPRAHVCTVTSLGEFTSQFLIQIGGFSTTGSANREGDHCPSGSSYGVALGGCASAGVAVPVTDSDLTTLDGFVKGKDGVWQRDLANELCNGKESCFQALSPTTQLTGPSVVTGTSQTTTSTTTPSAGGSPVTTTTTKTPTATVSYGPNYYDTTTTTTTTTNNGGNTTTTTADTTPFPNVPDMLGGANDGFGGLRDGIPATTSGTSPIPYMPWYSFSQQCSEITLVIPVYGAFETALCPIYAKYIWPVLYFIFAVYTWVTCWGIWRNTVLKVRAS